MKKIIRYIGSKEKLIDFLEENIFNEFKDKKINFFDGFSGSTFVSKYCHDKYDWNITLSDISKYTEILSSRLNISNCSLEVIETAKNLQYVDGIEGIISKEFSIGGVPSNYTENFYKTNGSRMFFSKEVGNKIDNMRNTAKDLYLTKKINIDELNFILMITIGFADKNANTTSVYGAYLKNQINNTKYIKDDFFELLIKERDNKKSVKFISGSIIDSLNKIEQMDVIYLDPPYNTRKYESNYHILNYIADINFESKMIKNNSKTALPLLVPQNLFGSKKGTIQIFEEMIIKSVNKSKNVFISYSTDGELSVKEVLAICDNNNILCEVYYKDYKRFKANDTNNNKELKEIIFKLKGNYNG